MKKGQRVTTMTETLMESGVSLYTGEPFIAMRTLDEDGNTMVGQMSPSEAREAGRHWFEVAEAAEQDAIVMKMLIKKFEVSDEEAATFVGMMRDERKYD